MDVQTAVDALDHLNKENLWEFRGNLFEHLCEILEHNDCKQFINDALNCFEPTSCLFNETVDDSLWKFLVLNLYLLQEIKKSIKLEKGDLLSIQQNKTIRVCVDQVTNLGIRANLQPMMTQFLKCKSTEVEEEANHLLKQYTRLSLVLKTFVDSLRSDNVLKPLLIFVSYQSILNGLYQIVYCPLKKPSADDKKGAFQMTQELNEFLVQDKKLFANLLRECSRITGETVHAKETMLLLKENKSRWFLRAVGANLTQILRAPNGLIVIVQAILQESSEYDTSKTWQATEVILKLITSLLTSADFESNICQQIKQLATVGDNSGGDAAKRNQFESIFARCVRMLFAENKELCSRVFLQFMSEPLRALLTDLQKVPESSWRSIRLMALVIGNESNDVRVGDVLTPALVAVLLQLHRSGSRRNEMEILRGILCRTFVESGTDVYNSLIFGEQAAGIKFEALGSEIRIVREEVDIAEVVLNFHRDNAKLLSAFFVYLLNKLGTNAEPQEDRQFRHKLLIYKLLSGLIDDKKILSNVLEQPKDIIGYIKRILEQAVERKVHRCVESDSAHFQTMFLVIMILQALLENGQNREVCLPLLEALAIIQQEGVDDELRTLAEAVVRILNAEETALPASSTPLDKAIDDVCDPLLPIRGHGLMTLAKLLENKDADALARKLYILNIFSQNLKHEDSFIYLAAINGLAIMGELMPQVVLETLTDEFLDYSGRVSTADGHEVRMKVGEVLVRITKNLGERACDYKTLLLNTFLEGCKDEDHLIRASSLSNLGEICRVLGFKLGPIVTDVLACIHDAISNDPAVEARRAAVTVTRQLFVGLESETISFLQEDLLDIYRTLKRIYSNDRDDITRLQAQLALEELDVNVGAFLLANLGKLKQ